MKLKLLNEEGYPVALIEPAGPKTGVVVSGLEATAASEAVNACRASLRAKLGRMPTPDEIVAELAIDTQKFETVL